MRTALERAGRTLVVMALGGVAWCQTPTLTTAQAATVRRLLTEARGGGRGDWGRRRAWCCCRRWGRRNAGSFPAMLLPTARPIYLAALAFSLLIQRYSD